MLGTGVVDFAGVAGCVVACTGDLTGATTFGLPATFGSCPVFGDVLRDFSGFAGFEAALGFGRRAKVLEGNDRVKGFGDGRS